ncbi:MAG: nucleoside triphosphate pyrophosphohydrolase [Chloroflexi bacterium]|nr:nucleoside triphosphate pyrophosphohydrolase [Chloroflexota bacterium]
MSLFENLSQFSTLLDIIAKLRAPDGCPWDKEQTHASLRGNLLEECYEVLAVLDDGNGENLCEELGDLLLQIVLHAQIAREAGEFEISDVVQSISRKLIQRHPHVFGSVKVKDAAEVLKNWEHSKQEERGGSSMLASLPRQMPALAYSQAIQQRVVQVGFDWADIDGVIDKLAEEVGEFKQTESQEQKAEEFGDLLFTLVNIGRRLVFESEAALREANQNFYRRFSAVEEVCRQRRVNIADLSFAEQNALWEEVKRGGEE